ncbi:protein of unknown function [Clostridium beijerinckii]|nr:protein of unknown function [Clostridium beijerinckii]
MKYTLVSCITLSIIISIFKENISFFISNSDNIVFLKYRMGISELNYFNLIFLISRNQWSQENLLGHLKQKNPFFRHSVYHHQNYFHLILH